ncbi:DUF4123 domain-containing protein [Photobacterium sp. GB-210]|uniref:DUF4123 domain-containing protein n=1 Tax=Photobacterium sp. GB-210 TaxID=2022104 RepID=UPI001304F422|nr:DUF4123 domain-containing protein [Photobacterium sp. GB-210]
MSNSLSTVIEVNSLTPLALKNYQYAIIEPQLCQEILKWYYTYSISPPLFKKLFDESPYQSIDNGPIIIQLDDIKDDFYSLIYDKAMQSPIGCFLTSRLSLKLLLPNLRGRLTAKTPSGESLFRFYEPRTLDAFISTLSEEEKTNIFSGIDGLLWWNDGWKYFSPPLQQEGELRPQFQWAISDQQIDNINLFLAS